jgi:hypothetical protein
LLFRGRTTSASRQDIAGLLEIPAPTYILGIHEPSKRVFIRSIHDGVAGRRAAKEQIREQLAASDKSCSFYIF